MKKQIQSVDTLIEHNGKILTLFRTDKTWGLPSGRIEQGEHIKKAALREIFEETGLMAEEQDLEHIKTFNWSFPEFDVNYPTFRLKLQEIFEVKLDKNEHTGFKWITPEECYKLETLIGGFKDILETVYGVKKKKASNILKK